MEHNPLYESEYLTIEYFPEKSLIISTWSINSVGLNQMLLKSELTKRLKYIEKLAPKNLLVNSKYFFYRVPTSIQNWMNNEVLKRYFEAGIEKMAFIISEDVVAQISIEQAIQEDDTDLYEIKYFDDIKSAKQWLLDL